MDNVFVDTSKLWVEAKNTYSKLRKRTDEPLHETWFRHMQTLRARALFTNPVMAEIDSSYPIRVQRWRTKFDIAMQSPSPQLVLPATATPGLRSLFQQVKHANRLADATTKWIQLHSRFTLDVLRLSGATTEKLNNVRAWFVSIASSWQKRIMTDSDTVHDLNQRKSEFLARILPADADEHARCFAESDCMLSLAKLLAVDEEVEKTASQLDCESRELTSHLTRLNTQRVTENTVAAAKAVRSAYTRSMTILSEELEELARIEKARLVAAESLDAAMHNSIASLRKMANRASVESVPASNQIHTLADFCAKQWLYLSTQVWLPPRPK